MNAVLTRAYLCFNESRNTLIKQNAQFITVSSLSETTRKTFKTIGKCYLNIVSKIVSKAAN